MYNTCEPKKVSVKEKMAVLKQKPNQLFKNICEVVENSKENVARVINQQLTLMYWQIGNLIRHDILQSKRADTFRDKRILSTMSGELKLKQLF